MKRFTVLPEHIALLRVAYVRWDDSEFGAPAIDSKRPYGNSAVVNDIADILHMDVARDECGPDLTDEERESLTALHKGTQTALQIVLSTGSFEPGEYECDDYRVNWRRATRPSL